MSLLKLKAMPEFFLINTRTTLKNSREFMVDSLSFFCTEILINMREYPVDKNCHLNFVSLEQTLSITLFAGKNSLARELITQEEFIFSFATAT